MSKIKKWWYRFWYNDKTRIFGVMIPSYFIVLIPLMIWIHIPEEYFRGILSFIYIMIFSWGVIDNDYSKLRETGIDEYRKPLKAEENKK